MCCEVPPSRGGCLRFHPACPQYVEEPVRDFTFHLLAHSGFGITERLERLTRDFPDELRFLGKSVLWDGANYIPPSPERQLIPLHQKFRTRKETATLIGAKMQNLRPLPKRLPRGGLFVLNDPLTVSPIPSLPEWTNLAPAEAFSLQKRSR